RRNIRDLRVDRNDGAIVAAVAFELLPVGTLDLNRATIEARDAVNGKLVAALDLLREIRLVEPDQLRPAGAVFDDSLEDLHALHGRYMRSGRYDFPAQQHRLVEVAADVGDAQRVPAVLVAERKEPDQIADNLDAVCGKRFGA